MQSIEPINSSKLETLNKSYLLDKSNCPDFIRNLLLELTEKVFYKDDFVFSAIRQVEKGNLWIEGLLFYDFKRLLGEFGFWFVDELDISNKVFNLYTSFEFNREVLIRNLSTLNPKSECSTLQPVVRRKFDEFLVNLFANIKSVDFAAGMEESAETLLSKFQSLLTKYGFSDFSALYHMNSKLFYQNRRDFLSITNLGIDISKIGLKDFRELLIYYALKGTYGYESIDAATKIKHALVEKLVSSTESLIKKTCSPRKIYNSEGIGFDSLEEYVVGTIFEEFIIGYKLKLNETFQVKIPGSARRRVDFVIPPDYTINNMTLVFEWHPVFGENRDANYLEERGVLCQKFDFPHQVFGCVSSVNHENIKSLYDFLNENIIFGKNFPSSFDDFSKEFYCIKRRMQRTLDFGKQKLCLAEILRYMNQNDVSDVSKLTDTQLDELCRLKFDFRGYSNSLMARLKTLVPVNTRNPISLRERFNRFFNKLTEMFQEEDALFELVARRDNCLLEINDVLRRTTFISGESDLSTYRLDEYQIENKLFENLYIESVSEGFVWDSLTFKYCVFNSSIVASKMSDVIFEECVFLNDSSFINNYLRNVTFKNVRFDGSLMSGNVFNECILTNTHFQSEQFGLSKFIVCEFLNTDLARINDSEMLLLEDCVINNFDSNYEIIQTRDDFLLASFDGPVFRLSGDYSAQVFDFNLSAAIEDHYTLIESFDVHSFNDCIFEQVTFVNNNFDNCDVINSCFFLTNLSNWSFDKVLVKRSVFIDSVFEEATFCGAVLDCVIFNMSEFTDVVFKDCNFRDVSFVNSKFTNVRFENCVFTGVNFELATLSNVIVEKSSNLALDVI